MCPEVVPTGGTSRIGNGYCDADLNIPQCQFDGGDCCAKTCVPNTLVQGASGGSALSLMSSRGCIGMSAQCWGCVNRRVRGIRWPVMALPRGGVAVTAVARGKITWLQLCVIKSNL